MTQAEDGINVKTVRLYEDGKNIVVIECETMQMQEELQEWVDREGVAEDLEEFLNDPGRRVQLFLTGPGMTLRVERISGDNATEETNAA